MLDASHGPSGLVLPLPTPSRPGSGSGMGIGITTGMGMTGAQGMQGMTSIASVFGQGGWNTGPGLASYSLNGIGTGNVPKSYHDPNQTLAQHRNNSHHQLAPYLLSSYTYPQHGAALSQPVHEHGPRPVPAPQQPVDSNDHQGGYHQADSALQDAPPAFPRLPAPFHGASSSQGQGQALVVNEIMFPFDGNLPSTGMRMPSNNNALYESDMDMDLDISQGPIVDFGDNGDLHAMPPPFRAPPPPAADYPAPRRMTVKTGASGPDGDNVQGWLLSTSAPANANEFGMDSLSLSAGQIPRQPQQRQQPQQAPRQSQRRPPPLFENGAPADQVHAHQAYRTLHDPLNLPDPAQLNTHTLRINSALAGSGPLQGSFSPMIAPASAPPHAGEYNGHTAHISNQTSGQRYTPRHARSTSSFTPMPPIQQGLVPYHTLEGPGGNSAFNYDAGQGAHRLRSRSYASLFTRAHPYYAHHQFGSSHPSPIRPSSSRVSIAPSTPSIMTPGLDAADSVENPYGSYAQARPDIGPGFNIYDATEPAPFILSPARMASGHAIFAQNLDGVRSATDADGDAPMLMSASSIDGIFAQQQRVRSTFAEQAQGGRNQTLGILPIDDASCSSAHKRQSQQQHQHGTPSAAPRHVDNKDQVEPDSLGRPAKTNGHDVDASTPASEGSCKAYKTPSVGVFVHSPAGHSKRPRVLHEDTDTPSVQDAPMRSQPPRKQKRPRRLNTLSTVALSQGSSVRSDATSDGNNSPHASSSDSAAIVAYPEESPRGKKNSPTGEDIEMGPQSLEGAGDPDAIGDDGLVSVKADPEDDKPIKTENGGPKRTIIRRKQWEDMSAAERASYGTAVDYAKFKKADTEKGKARERQAGMISLKRALTDAYPSERPDVQWDRINTFQYASKGIREVIALRQQVEDHQATIENLRRQLDEMRMGKEQAQDAKCVAEQGEMKAVGRCKVLTAENHRLLGRVGAGAAAGTGRRSGQ